jgi:nucleoside-diphosphate-sugar epimerase
MVVGTGSLANVFLSKFKKNNDVLIYASGVSDSTEKNKVNFDREKNLLINSIKNNPEKKLIYFSSIFVGYKNTDYYLHKLEIENLIFNNCSNYLIIRLPQILSKTGNKKNIINFFVDSLINNNKVDIMSESWRAIIDIDDVLKVSEGLISKHKNKIINFSNIEIIKVDDLYKKIAKIINKNESFNLLDFDEKIPIIENSKEVVSILMELNLIQEKYTDKILLKYLKKW